jgi:hypothetical protein
LGATLLDEIDALYDIRSIAASRKKSNGRIIRSQRFWKI